MSISSSVQRIFLSLWIGLIVHGYGWSQFTQFETNSKPSSNWIRCIQEDREGFIWIGTMAGLNRFDGIHYKSYFPTLEDGAVMDTITINSFSPLEDGTMLVGTDTGLYQFNPMSGVFTLRPECGENAVNDALIVQETLWAAMIDGITISEAGNLTKLRMEDILKNPSSWQSNLIHTLFNDSQNRMWIGTRTCLLKTNPDRTEWEVIPFTGNRNDQVEYDVLSIDEDAKGNIWIGTARSGFYCISKTESNSPLIAEKRGPGNVIDVMIDSHNRLWVAKSHSEGLDVYELDKLAADPEYKGYHYDSSNPPSGALSDNSAFTVYEDHNQNIWVGTFSGGLNFLPNIQKRFEVFDVNNRPEKAISSDLVNAFFEDKNYLWIGTENGLERLNKHSQTIEYFFKKPLPHGTAEFPVFAIEKEVNSNRLWIGTWAGGLFLFDPELQTFSNFLPKQVKGELNSENIFSIKDDGQGHLWMGTIGGGLIRMDLDTNRFYSYDHQEVGAGRSISDILLISDATLLYADYRDVLLFNTKTDEIERIGHHLNENGSNQGSIQDLFQDSIGNIWIASSKGLELLDLQTKRYSQIQPETGSLTPNICGIQEDLQGNLWLSTRDGLIKFVNGIHVPESPIFLTIDEKEGLSGNEFKDRSIYRSPNGKINVGSTNGFTRFFPQEIEFNTIQPRIVITGISELISNPDATSSFVSILDHLKEDSHLSLAHDQNYLQFEFAILNFINPHRNRYQYRMLGFDNNWITSPQGNKAIYTHLPFGEYEFQVKGTNNDDVQTENIATIRLIIHPPWWNTWFFRILAALLVAGSILLWFRYRIHREKVRNQLLQEKVEERTLELVAANQQLESRGKQIEQQNTELSFQKEHLEELVNERTSELSKALRKAEESDQLKTAFLENLTHEIRTPLNAIIGFSHLLFEQNMKEEEKLEYFKLIQLSGENLTEIVDNMIDVSMVRTQQLKISKQPVATDELLNSLHRQFREQLPKELGFDISLPEQTILVEADQMRIKQVINHLIKNAIKFTQQGSVTLGLKELNGMARFYVKDTGVGISNEKINSIFDPFFKIQEDRKILYGGTGIGLSLCKQLLELHQTSIQVESEPGKGSTFYFDLPILNLEDDNVKQTTQED